jgi:hypothetical protein
MLVKRTSRISGKPTTMEIDITVKQLLEWDNGALIQDAMPHLTPDEREFIKTGITPDEWNNMLGGNDA